MDALKKEFPTEIELRPVGQTVHGRQLQAALAGRRDRVLVLIGTMHGGESGPELIIPAFENMIRNHLGLLKEVGMAILPCVNADQRDRLAHGHPYYLRTNDNGVDLNRNFDVDWAEVDNSYGLSTADPDSSTYRGASPASEPETKAVLRLFEGIKPAAVLSFHHVGSLAGSEFVCPKVVKIDAAYRACCEDVNRVYRAAMGADDLLKRPVAISPECAGGRLPTWIYRQFGAPAFDVESDRSAACARANFDLATWDDLQHCQEFHCQAVAALARALGNAH
jgi:hypothetical protein